jgi:hypothetical protein
MRFRHPAAPCRPGLVGSCHAEADVEQFRRPGSVGGATSNGAFEVCKVSLSNAGGRLPAPTTAPNGAKAFSISGSSLTSTVLGIAALSGLAPDSWSQPDHHVTGRQPLQRPHGCGYGYAAASTSAATLSRENRRG